MFAMCLVVIGHITSGLRMPDRQWFVYLYVGFNMPLFVMLSSYMGYASLARVTSIADLFKYLQKITLRLAFPSLLVYNVVEIATNLLHYGNASTHAIIIVCVILLLYVLMNKCNKVAYASLLLLPMALDTNYWFIGMLIREMILFMLIYWLVNRFQKKFLWWFLSAIALAVAFKFNFGGYTVEFLPYFALGLLLRKYDVINTLLSKSAYLLCVFFFIAVVLYIYLFKDLYFYDNQLGVLKDAGRIWIWPLRLLCGTSWSMLFILLFARYSKRYTLISACGTLTMGIYLFQQPIFDNLLIRDIDLGLPVVPYWIVAFTIAVCILTAISSFCLWMQRFQLTRDLLLGEIARKS